MGGGRLVGVAQQIAIRFNTPQAPLAPLLFLNDTHAASTCGQHHPHEEPIHRDPFRMVSQTSRIT
jgi:hypothetical protein